LFLSAFGYEKNLNLIVLSELSSYYYKFEIGSGWREKRERFFFEKNFEKKAHLKNFECNILEKILALDDVKLVTALTVLLIFKEKFNRDGRKLYERMGKNRDR
jgi:hypothetical protein